MYLKFITKYHESERFIYFRREERREFSHTHKHASIKIYLTESSRRGDKVEKRHIGGIGTMILLTDTDAGVIQTRIKKVEKPNGVFYSERLTAQKASIEKRLLELIDAQDITDEKKHTEKDKLLKRLRDRLPTDEKTVRETVKQIKTSKKG